MRESTFVREYLHLTILSLQIMVSVMQSVSAQCPCSWREVLAFRRDHVGTPEQAARAIVYFKSQSQYRNLVRRQRSFYLRRAVNLYYCMPCRLPRRLRRGPIRLSSNIESGETSLIGNLVTKVVENYYFSICISRSPFYLSSRVSGPAVGKLVDLSSASTSDNNLAAGASSQEEEEEEQVGARATSRPEAQIPLTIKHLEEEHKYDFE